MKPCAVEPGAKAQVKLIGGLIKTPCYERSLYLVLWVGDHGRLPFTVHILVPVFRLLSVRVWNVLGFVPVLRK